MMDKYIKLENLGNGANSDVILVKNLQDKKLYALKRIFMEKDEKDNVKIKNEISILESLDHSNVIKYSESFEHNKKFCIVMEYADKGDLSHLIKKHKSNNTSFNEEALWNIFFQVSEAVRHIHSKKIIHRDIKSQNIFLTKIGLMKLGDFGISKTLENTTDFAKSFLGTPYFLSPEICAGSMYNYKSDVWMLGCVLYECASLKKPFSGETFMNLMHNIMNKNYDPIPDFYTDNFRELLSSLLEKDPTKRPMVSEVLNSNNFIKEKFKAFLETKKKLEVLCKSDRDQKINNSQIFNIDEATQVQILKGNYSTTTNKSFDFFDNHKIINSNISTPIHNNVSNTPTKITLRKTKLTEIQEGAKHTSNFNNFLINSEKSKIKSSMGNFHFNYNNKSVNKEYLDSEKPFIKEPNNKLSGYNNENNNNFSPINKKLVKKNQIVELEYTEETNNYMKLIVFLKEKIGPEKTNLLIKAVNFTNNDTIRFSLDNNYEQTKKILGSDYDNVVNLIRQIIMKVENNENNHIPHDVKKNDFVKKHKKTQSLGSMNFKQKI